MVAAIAGGAILAPAAEMIGARRNSVNLERLAHGISSFTVRFFAFAATWAVLALVLLVGLYPAMLSTLLQVFFWPLVAVVATWLLMTASAYYYYYSWKRLGAGQGRHAAVGWAFALSAVAFIGLITLLSSFQLTPTQRAPLVAAILNPTWLTELTHRLVGNFSYVGFVIAGIAGVRMLWSPGDKDRAYFDWLGNFGLLLGVGVLLLQPIVGWFYASQIQAGSPDAYTRVMVGQYSWLFLVQSFFLAVAFLLGNIYLTQTANARAKLGAGARAWMRWATVAIALLGVLLVIPQQFPLGTMSPWKYLGLAGFLVFGGTTLFLYLRAMPTFTWGNARAGSQWALVAAAVVAILLFTTMGVIRTTARGGEPIVGPLGGGANQQLVGQ